MILKRQDLIGENGSALKEEALATLASQEKGQQLRSQNIRSTSYFEKHWQDNPAPAQPTAAPVNAPTNAAPQPLQNQAFPGVQMPMPQQQPQQQNFAPSPVIQQNPANAQSPAPQQRLETRAAQQGQGRRLVVGPDISLNGEITSCDILVVEGQVQAVLKDCKQMEIAVSGYFKGNAELQDAAIHGLFEGNLVVHGDLYVSPSGKIRGSLRYNSMQVEKGGEISGEIESINAPGPRAAQATAPTGNARGTPRSANAQGASNPSNYNYGTQGTGSF